MGELPETTPDERRVISDIFNLTRKFRFLRGLPDLDWNGKIANVAFKHSKLQSKQCPGGCSHLDMDPRGRDRDVEAATGKYCSTFRENVGYAPPGYPVPEVAPTIVGGGKSDNMYADTVLNGKFNDGWIESHLHRKNILNRDVTEMGVSAYHYKGRWYFTQIFAKLRNY